MKPDISVDDKEFQKAVKSVTMTTQDLLDIAGAPARVIINVQRQLVPVDTSATQNSINSHIVEASDTKVIDDIGPETDYAPAIEMGIEDKPNYPIQPFVRPSVIGNEDNILGAAGAATAEFLESRWNQ